MFEVSKRFIFKVLLDAGLDMLFGQTGKMQVLHFEF